MRSFLIACLLFSPSVFAEVKLDPKSSADDVLLALQERGQNLKDFTADVQNSETDPITMRDVVTTGKIFFQRLSDGDARIRVNFDHKKAGALPRIVWHREYLLAKGEFVDQDFDTKAESHRQVLKPGEKMDPLKLGEGPFPLPIGQDPAEVKKDFDVSLVPATKDDPPGTLHVQLTPKPGTRFAKKYDLIEVWVDLQSHFTPRIKVTDLNETKIVTTDLTNIKVNGGLKDSDFKLAPPGRDWSVKNEALDD